MEPRLYSLTFRSFFNLVDLERYPSQPLERLFIDFRIRPPVAELTDRLNAFVFH